MKGSDFEFDGVNFLYYDFNEISLNRGGSYIDSPKWLKDKKSTINPKNNDDKYFQYVVTLALNFNKIKKDPQRISKIKPFIDQYNWKDIDFPSTSKDWRKFELNNKIALNILYVPHNTRKINISYKSKQNLTCDKQAILLMITDGEKWHYLTVKNLPGLLRGITSNHHGDFYCLNCFRSYRTKNKFELHKKICENHNYCHVEMPTKDNNTIKYNQGEKSIKLPFVVYADLECLLEKMSTYTNNPNESSTTEINKHCMRKFCKDLREHATKIINYEKKKMIPLTTEEKIHYNEQEICYICKKEFDKSNKKHYKVRDHCHYTGKYRGAAHNICNLRYKIPKAIPVVFHNGSIYDYHFIIKELVKEFDGNFECLGENSEKYITFSAPIKKKIENKDIEITYKIKFIDSYRFMSMPLSKLIDNLSDLSITEMNKTKVKMNKPIYLGLSILDISKILMYEFWYDYMKPKYGNKVKLCYMNTDSFIRSIKTNDFYKDIANDVEKRFDASNYEANRPLPTGKNKKVIVWIAPAESRSMRGASHQPIFMGDCLTICHTYLPCLPW